MLNTRRRKTQLWRPVSTTSTTRDGAGETRPFPPPPRYPQCPTASGLTFWCRTGRSPGQAQGPESALSMAAPEQGFSCLALSSCWKAWGPGLFIRVCRRCGNTSPRILQQPARSVHSEPSSTATPGCRQHPRPFSSILGPPQELLLAPLYTAPKVGVWSGHSRWLFFCSCSSLLLYSVPSLFKIKLWPQLVAPEGSSVFVAA